MKKHLPFSLCLAATMLVLTSFKGSESLFEIFKRINQEILLNSKAYSTLKEATTTIGHRLTGSSNGKKAEQYIFDKFKEYGFKDVAFQEFEVEAWSRGKVDVKIDGKKVPAVTLGHAPLKAEVTGEIVDVGNGLEEDYPSQDIVKGKIAFLYIGILEGSPKGLHNLHRSEKTAIAIRHGAVGVIIFNQVEKGVLLTGTASVTGELIPIPAVCIGKEDGISLKSELKSRTLKADIIMTNNSSMIKARNVIATLKGRDLPNERIMIGGHLDSWDLATGAIDNGIGSFSILDMARAFKANNLQPKRTVQFVMFMGEEEGLLGSRYMVKKEIKDRSIDQIRYMINVDMSGNPIGINSGGKLSDTTFFPALGQIIHEVDTIFKNKISKASGLHSDHQPFMLEGIPVLGMIPNLDWSVYRCYHSDCDDFSLVNEKHLVNTVRFGTMILYGLADAEKMPASKMDSETTKQFMIDNHLKEPLILGKDWKWDK